MKKIFLDYCDWKTLLFGENDTSSSEQELLDSISRLASHVDIKVILTENEIPSWVLKFDKKTNRFNEFKISDM